MKNNRVSPTESAYSNKLKSVKGTFAAEGIVLSAKTLKNLERVSVGGVDYKQILAELRQEYARER